MPDTSQTLVFTMGDDASASGLIEDATIATGGSEDDNYGIFKQLYIDLENGSHNNAESRALVRFAKAFGSLEGQVPRHAIIEDATLTLRVTNEGGDVTAHAVLESWDVDEVTWQDRGGDAGPWSEVGAGSPSSEDTAAATFHVAAGETATLDLTALAQDWALHPTTNLGILLRTQSTDGTDLAASEYDEVAARPTLTVTYTLGDELEDTAEPDTGPGNGSDTAGDTGSPHGADQGGADTQGSTVGCGCTTGTLSPGIGWFLLGAVVLGRRLS